MTVEQYLLWDLYFKRKRRQEKLEIFEVQDKKDAGNLISALLDYTVQNGLNSELRFGLNQLLLWATNDDNKPALSQDKIFITTSEDAKNMLSHVQGLVNNFPEYQTGIDELQSSFNLWGE
jgi:hypothetical protein